MKSDSLNKLDNQNSYQPNYGAFMKTTFLLLFILAVLLSGCQSTSSDKAEAPFVPDPAHLDLIKRVEAGIIDINHPGREYANSLRGKHYKEWFHYMKTGKKKPVGGWSMAGVVKDSEKLLKLVEVGKTWPKPGEYKIPKTKKAPTIDGKLDDEAWKNAATWNDIYPYNKSKKGGPKTTWKITWDDKNLYFAFDCKDTDVTAKKRKRDGHIYQDDCVEIMIMPEFKFRTYWEIIIAPNGSVYDSVQCKNVNQWGLHADTKLTLPGLKHAQVIDGTINNPKDVDKGYTVEVAVPFSALPEYSRATPKVGHRLNFVLIRLDRNYGKFTPYAFRPLQAWGHNIWNHAVMELAD
ncbi:MAG: carbohydrate-binding family 9-like protein [Lentisphaeria bacterium]|nr:carbohydrate-binding family 9-like protein [Lentisphaeria bacterium]